MSTFKFVHCDFLGRPMTKPLENIIKQEFPESSIIDVSKRERLNSWSGAGFFAPGGRVPINDSGPEYFVEQTEIEKLKAQLPEIRDNHLAHQALVARKRIEAAEKGMEKEFHPKPSSP